MKANTILLNTDYLKTCIDYILKNDNNELYHVIGIIKAIGYIKPYLYQLVKYIVEERYLLTSPDNYLRIVDNIGNQELKQMLQLYIIKLFKHHMNKDLKSLMRTVDWNSSLIISQNEVNDIVQNEILKNIIETDSFPAEDGSSSYPYQNLFRVFPYPEIRSFETAILDNKEFPAFTLASLRFVFSNISVDFLKRLIKFNISLYFLSFSINSLSQYFIFLISFLVYYNNYNKNF